MPDITMCSGGDCLVKEMCRRFKSKPSTHQSYFTKEPFEFNFKEEEQPNFKCDLFINRFGKKGTCIILKHQMPFYLKNFK